MPSSSAYRTRFGSLVNAYRLAGYTPERNFEYLEVNRQLRQVHPQLLGDMIQDLQTMGATVERDSSSDVLTINGLYKRLAVLGALSIDGGWSSQMAVPRPGAARRGHPHRGEDGPGQRTAC